AQPVELRKIFSAVKVENLPRRQVRLIRLIDIGNCLQFRLFQLGFGCALRGFSLRGKRALIVVQKQGNRKHNSSRMIAADTLVLVADIYIPSALRYGKLRCPFRRRKQMPRCGDVWPLRYGHRSQFIQSLEYRLIVEIANELQRSIVQRFRKLRFVITLYRIAESNSYGASFERLSHCGLNLLFARAKEIEYITNSNVVRGTRL